MNGIVQWAAAALVIAASAGPIAHACRRNAASIALSRAVTKTGVLVSPVPCGTVTGGSLPAGVTDRLAADGDYRNLGTAWLAAGDSQKAEAAFRRALSLHEDPPATLRLAQCLVAEGRPREAAALLRTLRESNASQIDGYGEMLLNARNLNASLGCYELAATFAPANAAAHLGIGRVLLELDRADAAMPELDEAVRLCPSCSDAYVFRALARVRRNEDAAATERDFQQAIALDPNGFVPQLAWVRWLSSVGRFDEAIRSCRRLAQLYPQHPEPQRLLHVLTAARS